MTDFRRRTLLAGSAAAATAALPAAGPSTALAAASPVGKQAPGYYRYKSAATRSPW
jgi:hypothetical protein